MMISTRLPALAVLSLGAILLACGDGSTLSRDEARLAFRAFNRRFSDTSPPRLQRDALNACAEGGHVRLFKVGVHEAAMFTEGALEGCTSQGVVLDGTMRTRSTLPGAQGFGKTPSRVTLSEEGKFTVQGSLQGICSIDMHTDHVPALHEVLQRRGRFCGFEVQEITSP